MRLDPKLGLIQATDAFFEANPQHKAFTFDAHVPGEDRRVSGEYHFVITRDQIPYFKNVALADFEDLRNHENPLALALARDIKKSWELPPEELIVKEILDTKVSQR